MIKEAIECLFNKGKDTARVVRVHENHDDVTKLIVYPDGRVEKEIYDKPAPEICHQFSTIDSLIEYINSYDYDNTNGVVHVNETFIKADLTYGKHERSTAQVILSESADFKALRKLFVGVTQKELWQLLITDLDECISNELFASIAAIEVSKNTESKIEIANTGLESGDVGTKVNIRFQKKEGADMQDKSLGLKWDYTGHIWECFNEVRRISLRLELLQGGNGLVFQFHPKQLKQRLKEHLNALAGYIRMNVPDGLPVYEGCLIYDGEAEPMLDIE